MADLRLRLLDGTIHHVIKEGDYELIELNDHFLAVHKHHSKKRTWQVTEPVTGFYIALGPSKEAAIKSAKLRIAEQNKQSASGDAIAEAIKDQLRSKGVD